MGIELPNSGNVFLPAVPSEDRLSDPRVLREAILDVYRHLEELGHALFTNDLHIATAINLGISGTFAISSGGSILVTSGIVINVTS